jgi:hypothetical protein
MFNEERGKEYEYSSTKTESIQKSVVHRMSAIMVVKELFSKKSKNISSPKGMHFFNV